MLKKSGMNEKLKILNFLDEEVYNMNMYEEILEIIEKNGPASLPSILEAMSSQGERENSLKLSHIKSVISRKKDLFSVKDNIVSINPDKEIVSLTASVGRHPGPWYKVKINFQKNTFFYIEWTSNEHQQTEHNLPQKYGRVEDFKKELFKMKIWDWKHDYQRNEMILDGTSWSIKLETKGATYSSGGFQEFPKEWSKFCRAMMNLTGKSFK
ncbi:hypothetical protein [Bacillus canaveralius]|uniref:hypothetical protein n=1 Tax=Bacillus canaveralius TaxID=1403243 RepID=UPI001FE7A793|nr:hypothetical protein [Bacillus canaveralius]